MYWRVHWSDLPPFNADNAWTRPWGQHGDVKAVRGYSATKSAEELVRYFKAHGSDVGDDDPIVLFDGYEVGVGPDLEPLVVPKKVVAWFRGADLDRGLLAYENDPSRFDAVVRRLGRKRRLR